MYRIFETLDKVVQFDRVSAHCDIPCGIYDPHQAQIAALTVIRMIDLMTELSAKEKQENLEYHNTISRLITVKEEHAELCKQEIRVIWGDYFKAEHVEKHPEIHSLTHNIMQLGSKCRQAASREAALDLLKSVNQFAGIYWETKGIQTKTVKAPYKPGEEIVIPVL